MLYLKSFVVFSTVFKSSLSGVDSISRNHFFMFIHKKTILHLLKLYHEIATVQLYLHAPFLILILLLFAPYLKLLLPLKHEFLKVIMRVGIKFFQIPADVGNVTSTHELWMFLIDLEWWVLSRSFPIHFAHIHERNLVYGSYILTKIYLLNHKTWKSNLLLDPWDAEWWLC